MSLDRKIEQALQAGDVKDQVTRFCSLADEVLVSGPAATQNLKAITDKLLSDEVQQQVTKLTLLHLAKIIDALPADDMYDLACHMITAIKNNITSYDETDYILREKLFKYYLDCEQFSDAAQILSGINLDSTSRPFSEKEKTDVYVRCAETFLEDDESIDAEIFVNKASALINAVDDVALLLRYRVTYARVLDANRKFIEAAVRYYELSTTTTANILQDELLELLGKAVTCAILGKAGQQRTRVLGLLYQDDRLGSLDQLSSYSSHCTVLSKMFRAQILKKDELVVFEESLMAHQKALTADGFTIPEKAVIEHNMAATGRVYDNIRFSELGRILGLDENRVEKIAAAMITENRLKASIDQTESLLIFEEDSDPLLSWDEGIGEICNDINEFADTVQANFSDLLVAQSA